MQKPLIDGYKTLFGFLTFGDTFRAFVTVLMPLELYLHLFIYFS